MPIRVQFTCEIKEVAGVSGRADIKAMKAITAKVNPARLIILRGCVNPTVSSTALTPDCDALMKFATSNGIEAFGFKKLNYYYIFSYNNICSAAPRNRSSVTFNVPLSKLQMTIPQSLLPQAQTSLKQFSSSTLTLQETKSTVTALLGSFQVKAAAAAALEASEAKVVKYQGLQIVSGQDEPDSNTFLVDNKPLEVTLADLGNKIAKKHRRLLIFE